MIRKILQFPSKRLRLKSENAKDVESLKGLINDLKDTLRYEGGVGLAAPQINKRVRVILVKVVLRAGIPPRNVILINPEIVRHEEEAFPSREACLSIPGRSGTIARWKEIQVKYLEPDGTERQSIFLDGEACVVQHEIDHLDGILFIDRLEDGKGNS